MSVSSIDPVGLGQVARTSLLGTTPASPPAPDADGDDDGSAGTPSSVSPSGQLLGQLQQLQQTDPAKLKTVLGDIASALQAASQQDGGGQGDLLSQAASKFKQAAQTGDLSSLQPAHHHHGHHHHRAAAAYQQSDGSGFPGQGASGGATASAPGDPRQEIFGIIDKVLAQDVGSTSGA